MASNPQPQIGEVKVWVDEGGVRDGTTYNAIVPVTWTVAGSNAKVSAEYMVPVKKEGERWFVAGEPVAAQQSSDVQGGSAQVIPEPADGVKQEKYPSSQESEKAKPSSVNPSDSSGSEKK